MTQKEKLAQLIWANVWEDTDHNALADTILANGYVDLSHISLIEFVESYAYIEIPKVALFNNNHLSQEEAIQITKSGEYHPSVLTLPRQQWLSLFLNTTETRPTE